MASNSKSIESMEGQNVNLNDDELDFDDETNEHHKSDEGELSDDELEEGELKDDDDDDDEEEGNLIGDSNNIELEQQQQQQQQQQKKVELNEPTNQLKRPNQTQQNVCRFYSKGNCTWGANCRFAHVNVKRNVKPQHNQHSHQSSQSIESSWERGLQRAKEALERASQRKSTDQCDDAYERRRELAFKHLTFDQQSMIDPWNRHPKSDSESEFSSSNSSSKRRHHQVDGEEIDSWSDSSLSDSISDDTSSSSSHSHSNSHSSSHSQHSHPTKKRKTEDQSSSLRREELLAQLKQVEEQIAKKKQMKTKQ